jgi:hypothetical protein
MNPQPDPQAADRQFFASLLEADPAALARILADDFILIEVMNGSEITRPALLAAIESGQVKFDAIDPSDNLVRRYDSTAVITGRTRMEGSVGEARFEVNSRYTHVYVMLQGEWRLAAAQGTRILHPQSAG